MFLLFWVAVVTTIYEVQGFTNPHPCRLIRESRQLPHQSFRLHAGFGAKKDPVDLTVTRPDASAPCACGSGTSYGDCCEPFHARRSTPATPTQTVRARYTAMTCKIVPYIISTTHPSSRDHVSSDQKGKLRKVRSDSLTFSHLRPTPLLPPCF